MIFPQAFLFADGGVGLAAYGDAILLGRLDVDALKLLYKLRLVTLNIELLFIVGKTSIC